MLKISESKRHERAITLQLEGQIIGPWVDELERVSEPLVSRGLALVLDLTEVVFVDAEGVALLAGFGQRGVTLRNCSPFVEEQLKSLEITRGIDR